MIEVHRRDREGPGAVKDTGRCGDRAMGRAGPGAGRYKRDGDSRAGQGPGGDGSGILGAQPGDREEPAPGQGRVPGDCPALGRMRQEY